MQSDPTVSLDSHLLPIDHKEETPYQSAKYIPEHTFTVASWDGGGVRGIIPATIMEEISRRAGLEPYEFLDLSVGTSTGGLLTAAYLSHDGSQKPLFKASQVTSFWKENVEEIFHPRCLFETFDGFFKSKYNADGLEKVIDQFARDDMDIQKNMLRPCVFTSFDATSFKPFYFRTRDVSSSSDPTMYRIKKVLRCTTAAPGYLPAQQIMINNVAHAFLDGGLVHNNPTMVALEEARCLAGNKKIEILSYGTGFVDESIAYHRLADAGFVTYMPIILNLFFGAMEAHPDIVLNERPQCLREKEIYHRFQVEKLEDSESELDSVKSLDYLEGRAGEWINLHDDYLREVSSGLKIKDPYDPYAKPLEHY